MGPFFHTPQIEVRMMDTRDAEHELRIEITENELRKEFTWTERLEYARRLERIESINAKERMLAGKAINPVANLPQGKTRNIVAAQLGTSATQLRKAQAIADNADLLDPADFAKVGIYADQRIGEILRELPTRQGKRSDLTSSPIGNEVTKSDALKDAGFTPKTAAQLEQLAANPDVVQAVLDKAEAEGRI